LIFFSVYCSKFVYISGREYCIFTETLYQDEAQLVCQNTNGMNLITFDDRDNKYFEVLDWLPNNGISSFKNIHMNQFCVCTGYSGYFWTSGFRGEGESIWTWRSTNKTITSFKWAWHSPSLDEDLTSKVCIGFLATDNTVDAGWADFRCNQEFPLNTICEHYP